MSWYEEAARAIVARIDAEIEELGDLPTPDEMAAIIVNWRDPLAPDRSAGGEGMKPRQIVTVDHAKNCRIRQWVHLSYDYLRRDKLGRRNMRTHTAFLVFRCNDTDCPAQMIMPWGEVAEALYLNPEMEGKKR